MGLGKKLKKAAKKLSKPKNIFKAAIAPLTLPTQALGKAVGIIPGMGGIGGAITSAGGLGIGAGLLSGKGGGMGDFLGTSKSSRTTNEASTQTKLDPYTKKFTEGYTGMAPWIFNNLDPQSALNGMFYNTDVGPGGKANEFWNAEGRYTGSDPGLKQLQGAADSEAQQRQDMQERLTAIKERQTSGKFLSAEQTQFINESLNKAFEYANTTGTEQLTRYAQELAGGRGLRTSDTPVAAPAMREMQNFQLGLGSQRAQQGLSATLDMSKQQQIMDQAYEEFARNFEQEKTNTRAGFMFGGGLSGVSGIGGTTTATGSTTTPKPSGLSQITGLLDLGSKAGSMIAMSDRRLKSEIKRIGTHVLGIGIYSYKIFGKYAQGVMADEVRLVRPEAVIRHSSGYDMVDYSKLRG